MLPTKVALEVIEGSEERHIGPAGHILHQVLVWDNKYLFWITCLIVPFLLFPNKWTWLALLALPLPWFLRWLYVRRITCSTPLDLPILLLVIMIPVSLYASVDLELSLINLLQIIAGVFLFYAAVSSLSSVRDLTRLVYLLILGGVALALIAPLGTGWVTDKIFSLSAVYERLPRLLPETVNPNVLAGAIVLVVPLSLSLLVSDEPRVGRPRAVRSLLFLALVVMLATVGLTQSRGGYVALAAGLLVVAGARFRWVLLVIPLSILALSIVVHTVGLTTLVDALWRTTTLGGWEGRQEVWSRALYMIQDFPYTGIGLGTFSKVGPVMYPYFILGPDAEVSHAHNLFLQVGVDLGIPGLIAFLAILIGSLFMAVRTYVISCRTGTKEIASISLGLLGGFVALVVHGVSDAVTWGSKPSVLPWLLFACTVIVYRLTLGGGKRETASS